MVIELLKQLQTTFGLTNDTKPRMFSPVGEMTAIELGSKAAAPWIQIDIEPMQLEGELAAIDCEYH